ncbi:MAG: 16S rRNA (guanine(527)-N(7))-methyltransferase RsmG [Bacteroidales bacterium]|jgi:16S rRNA (guanine527-N7)-methyltransferase|nr:16S rRNA (guanine(527)-N(7))-methyltransferase RsmG [Bacteroidales bacterium]
MDIILNYFPTLTDKQIQQIKSLQDLYTFWNAQINVISRKDIGNLYLHHVLHSLSIAKLMFFKPQTSILDVGSGGGFPAIPLAILFPCVKFHLVDTVGRKIKVIQAIAKELGLFNVKCTQIHAEQVNDKYDFIIGRSVSTLPVFYNWVKKIVSPDSVHDFANGILYLKGGDIWDEIKKIPRQAVAYPVNTWFEEEYFSEKYIIHIPVSDK